MTARVDRERVLKMIHSGMTQRHIAAEVGCHPDTVSEIGKWGISKQQRAEHANAQRRKGKQPVADAIVITGMAYKISCEAW